MSPQEEKFIYASAKTKIKAFLTDSFMLLLPIIYFVIYIIMGGREAFASHKSLGWVYILIPLLLVQTLFMLKTAQTPGYRAYNIKIIDENTKKTPSLSVLIFRNLSVILSVLTFLGWIIMFFRKDSKTLHDFLSSTAIVYEHNEK